MVVAGLAVATGRAVATRLVVAPLASVQREEQRGGGSGDLPLLPTDGTPPPPWIRHHHTDPAPLRLLPHHRPLIRWLATVKGGPTSLRQIQWRGGSRSGG